MADDTPSAAPHYHGHRQRLRERFAASGGEGLPDYELLELVLFRSRPRVDVKGLAKGLVKRFGSFAAVLSAPADRLRERVEVEHGRFEALGDGSIQDLQLVRAAAQRIARGAIEKKQVLSSWSSVLEYCRTAIGFAEREEFHILFLDKRNALIADERQGTGTVDHTPVYPREVLRRALELSATAVILVHNHPSGDPTPSQADIAMTREIASVAKPLGIQVHDHIIVGRDGHASLKGLKLI